MKKSSAHRLSIERLEDRLTPAAFGEVGSAIAVVSGATGNVDRWYIRNQADQGAPDIAPFDFGNSNDMPIVGDWNGNGRASIGSVDFNRTIDSKDFGLIWSLTDDGGTISQTPNGPIFGGLNPRFTFGTNIPIGFATQGTLPIVGDWNGDGTDTIGTSRIDFLSPPNVGSHLYSQFELRNSNSAGAPDSSFTLDLGIPPGAGFLVVVGDWDGNGTTTVGVFDESTATWYLKNTNASGSIFDSDVITFRYGTRFTQPVVGDWDGNGTTTVGVYDRNSSVWFLRNSNTAGAPDIAPFAFGQQFYGKPLFIPHTAPTFALPIGGTAYQDWVPSNYVNVGTPDAPQDYRGGNFTWNRSTGDEYSLANYAAMDRGVPVLAAAQGVVIGVANDQPDRNQTPVIGPIVERGNYVFIDHGFGWYSSYFHLKRGSVTVQPGDIVAPGQPIGQVGGSGSTDRPKLDFYTAFGGRPVETLALPAAKRPTPLPTYLGDTRGAIDGGFTTTLWDRATFIERPTEPATIQGSTTSATVLYFWVTVYGVRTTDEVAFKWLKPPQTVPVEVARFTGRDSRFRGMHVYIPINANSSTPANATWGDNTLIVEINGVEVFRKTKRVEPPVNT